MLLCIMGYATFGLRNPTILKSVLFNFIHNITDVMTSANAARLSLLYLIASVGASSYDNEPRFHVTCDNSSMHLNVEFDNSFHGVIYTSGNLFLPQCSFPTSPVLNSTKLMVSFPFSVCNFNVGMINEERISIFSTVVVQQHRILRTLYDVLQNVTCEVPISTDTFRQLYYPNASTSRRLPTTLQPDQAVETWIETRTGSDLLPDEHSEELFLVVYVKDGGKNKDLSVHNCIAHDEKVLTNETLLYQMSDIFGCSNSSYVMSNFTVGNQTEDGSGLMAYTQMRDLVYTVKGEFFVTCGVVLCETSCPDTCENEANHSMYHLSDIATKRFAGRLPGATLPPSLDLFEWRQRISKRSLRETLSRWFSFGSSNKIDNESFQEGLASETILIGDKDEYAIDVLDTAAILKDWDDVLDKAVILKDLDVFDNATIVNERDDMLDNVTILNDWNDVLDKAAILKDLDMLDNATIVNERDDMLDNATILNDWNDVLGNATILKDLGVPTSDNLLEEFKFGNGTDVPSLGNDNQLISHSIWPEFTVCVLFVLLVGCYGGLLYSNSKKRLDWIDGNTVEMYSIVH